MKINFILRLNKNNITTFLLNYKQKKKKTNLMIGLSLDLDNSHLL